MKARSLLSVLVVIALGMGGPLFLTRFSPRSAESARKGKPGPKAAPAQAAPLKAGKKPVRPAPIEDVISPAPQEQGGLSTAVVPTGQVVLRLTFRPKPVEGGAIAGTNWEGGMTVSGGRIASISPLREDPLNRVEGNRWFLQNIRKMPQGESQRKLGIEKMPFAETGLQVNLAGAGPSTRVDVKTAQGDFAFQLADVPMGAPKPFLRGLARVERVPNSAIILSAPTEDDFPAAAYSPTGVLYVVYVSFTPGKDFPVRSVLDNEKDMAKLAEPTGGDQIFLMRLEGGKWTVPIPVTPPNQDVFRPALAIDGDGRAWVFWTAKAGGQWELFARSLMGGQWSEPLQLTNTPGPDVMPAAARDAEGRVWVAWQAFRTNNSDILAMRQEGDTFGEPMVVAEDKANEWTPAIAADKSGDVAVVWDTYAKGDYDVYARVWSKGQFGEPIAIAATLRAEMRPTAAYDPTGRLWIAYEDSPEKWGKDWGGLEKEGVKLYLRRRVSVRVWAGGQLYEPAGDANAAFLPAGVAGRRPATKLTGVKTEELATTKEKLAEAKRTETVGGPSVAAPRLTVDASGRVWLAVRGPAQGRTNVGSVWHELVSCYDGGAWSGSIFCPHTDNLLDSRPAVLSRPSGGVALIISTDGRAATEGRESAKLLPRLRKETGKDLKPVAIASKWPDPNNLDIAMVEVDAVAGKGSSEFQLKAVAPAPPVLSSPEEIKEAEDIARMRAEKIVVAGKSVSVFRGDFHRHTEISADGGGDGMLMDMWRYALDAANMDWIGNGDHDNGGGREYYWWLTQKTTDIYTIPGAFTPMYTYERSVTYPDGHRNVVWATRGVRTLPRDKNGMGKIMDDQPDAPRPHSPDTERLYRYLKYFDGVCASHTSATNMGTDWRDNDAESEPMVEIYQGCRQNYEMPGAPRSNTADFSIGGWRPMGFVSNALAQGYRLGFQSSSDHGAVHMSYCNVWVEAPTREAILEGMKRRHIYGSTTNIIGEFFCGEHFMGDEFSMPGKPTFKIRIVGTGPLAKVHVIKDGKYAYTTSPQRQEVEMEWTDVDAQPGKTSYYYVRGEQADGELVWISPMWITFKP